MSPTLLLFLILQPPEAPPPPPPAPPPPPPAPTLDEPPAPGGPREASDDAFGDLTTAGLSLRTLTQVRYASTVPHAGTPDERATVQDGDGWQLHRLFVRLVTAPSKHMQARLLVDFAELLHKNQKKALKLAYVELRPWKRLEITAGLFKRRFSLLELLPIADYELADVGPTDTLIKDMGYGGRDVGGMVRVMPLAKKRYLSLWLGAFAGDPEEGYDVSLGKLVTARAETRAVPFLRLGADFAWRTSPSVGHEKFPNYLAEIMVLDRGKAASADVTLSGAGAELRLEGMLGQRTDALWRLMATDFAAAWLLGSYRFPIAGVVLMPAARAEWLDGDRKAPGGARLYLTAGLNVELNDNIRVLVDLSRYLVESNTPALNNRPWPEPASGPDIDVRVNDLDWWAVIAQLQIKI
jgi:hypothetical protein